MGEIFTAVQILVLLYRRSFYMENALKEQHMVIIWGNFGTDFSGISGRKTS